MNYKLQFTFLTIAIISMMFPFILNSQTQSDSVKMRMDELFSLCKEDKYSEASSYIVYHGIDDKRRWKDISRYENEDERNDVVQTCKEIKNYLTYGGDYDYVSFQTETESEGEWCVWEVKFEKGERKKVYFAFLEIKGKYCLGDID